MECKRKISSRRLLSFVVFSVYASLTSASNGFSVVHDELSHSLTARLSPNVRTNGIASPMQVYMSPGPNSESDYTGCQEGYLEPNVEYQKVMGVPSTGAGAAEYSRTTFSGGEFACVSSGDSLEVPGTLDSIFECAAKAAENKRNMFRFSTEGVCTLYNGYMPVHLRPCSNAGSDIVYMVEPPYTNYALTDPVISDLSLTSTTDTQTATWCVTDPCSLASSFIMSTDSGTAVITSTSASITETEANKFCGHEATITGLTPCSTNSFTVTPSDDSNNPVGTGATASSTLQTSEPVVTIGNINPSSDSVSGTISLSDPCGLASGLSVEVAGTTTILSPSASTFTVPGLEGCTNYVVNVSATDSGDSNIGTPDSTSFTTNSEDAVLTWDEPDHLTPSFTSMTLAWLTNDDCGLIDTYRISWSSGSRRRSNDVQLRQNSGTAETVATSYTIENLAGCSSVTVSVVGVDTGGNSVSNTITGTESTLTQTPTLDSISFTGDFDSANVDLAWTVTDACSLITSYSINVPSELGAQNLTSTDPSISFFITTCQTGDVEVTGYDDAGNSYGPLTITVGLYAAPQIQILDATSNSPTQATASVTLEDQCSIATNVDFSIDGTITTYTPSDFPLTIATDPCTDYALSATPYGTASVPSADGAVTSQTLTGTTQSTTFRSADETATASYSTSVTTDSATITVTPNDPCDQIATYLYTLDSDSVSSVTPSQTYTGLSPCTSYNLGVLVLDGDSNVIDTYGATVTTDSDGAATVTIDSLTPAGNSIDMAYTVTDVCNTIDLLSVTANGVEKGPITTTESPFTISGLSSCVDYTVVLTALDSDSNPLSPVVSSTDSATTTATGDPSFVSLTATSTTADSVTYTVCYDDSCGTATELQTTLLDGTSSNIAVSAAGTSLCETITYAGVTNCDVYNITVDLFTNTVVDTISQEYSTGVSDATVAIMNFTIADDEIWIDYMMTDDCDIVNEVKMYLNGVLVETVTDTTLDTYTFTGLASCSSQTIEVVICFDNRELARTSMTQTTSGDPTSITSSNLAVTDTTATFDVMYSDTCGTAAYLIGLADGVQAFNEDVSSDSGDPVTKTVSFTGLTACAYYTLDVELYADGDVYIGETTQSAYTSNTAAESMLTDFTAGNNSITINWVVTDDCARFTQLLLKCATCDESTVTLPMPASAGNTSHTFTTLDSCTAYDFTLESYIDSTLHHTDSKTVSTSGQAATSTNEEILPLLGQYIVTWTLDDPCLLIETIEVTCGGSTMTVSGTDVQTIFSLSSCTDTAPASCDIVYNGYDSTNDFTGTATTSAGGDPTASGILYTVDGYGCVFVEDRLVSYDDADVACAAMGAAVYTNPSGSDDETIALRSVLQDNNAAHGTLYPWVDYVFDGCEYVWGGDHNTPVQSSCSGTPSVNSQWLNFGPIEEPGYDANLRCTYMHGAFTYYLADFTCESERQIMCYFSTS